MQTPFLNFQARPGDRWLGHTSSAGWRRAASLALLLAGLALAACAWRVLAARQALDDAQAAQAQAAAQSRQAATRRPPQAGDKGLQGAAAGASADGLSVARLRALNTVVDRLNQPWVSLLDTLARETQAPVTLIALAADGERGTLRLEAEAPGLPALLAYARRLESAPLIDQMQLLRHQAQDADRLRPMRLSLDLVLARASHTAAAQPTPEPRP